MSRAIRILIGAILVGMVVAMARQFGPRAYEACRSGCGSASTDEPGDVADMAGEMAGDVAAGVSPEAAI
jgi:hypothetical protein